MNNVPYHVDLIENGIVYITETFDLTQPGGPGILVSGGKPVDVKAEGIVSASRRIMMTEREAIELGIVLK
jgi:propanediol utilization protein